MKNLTIYAVKLTFTEPMLGTAPSNPDVYADFVASKRFASEKKLAKTTEEIEALKQKEEELAKEELAMLPDEQVEKGTTVFRRDPVHKNLILTDHMIRGFLKEGGSAIGDANGKTWGLTQKIDRWVFVTDAKGKPMRVLPLKRNGKAITEPDGTFERPLRAMTMQGPRVTLACSEIVNPVIEVDFHLTVLPLAQGEKHQINEDTIKSWLEYGQYCGIGQWRNGGYGRFETTITKL
jgi:hypothetical protein